MAILQAMRPYYCLMWSLWIIAIKILFLLLLLFGKFASYASLSLFKVELMNYSHKSVPAQTHSCNIEYQQVTWMVGGGQPRK